MTFLSQYFADRLSGAHAMERAQRARLRSELESYRTEAERNELSAILSRHSAEQIEQLEAASGWRAA